MKNGWKKFLALTLLLTLCVSCALAEDTVDVILNAGTTQAFAADPVAEEDLNRILEAGLSTASAINQQPWHFVVVTNQDMMTEIVGSGGFGGGMPAGMPAGMPEGMTPPEGMSMPAGAPAGMPAGGMPAGVPAAGGSSAKAALGDSPVAIIIYMNPNTASPDPSFDCGQACQNMIIAANALGYGTKVISSPTMSLNGANHDALCEKLGVDTAYTAVAVLLIGKTDAAVDGATGATTRSPLEEKVSLVK